MLKELNAEPLHNVGQEGYIAADLALGLVGRVYVDDESLGLWRVWLVFRARHGFAFAGAVEHGRAMRMACVSEWCDAEYVIIH